MFQRLTLCLSLQLAIPPRALHPDTRQCQMPCRFVSFRMRETMLLTAIEHATPTSAIHPPSAAEIVAPRLNNIPMAEAVRRKVIMLARVSAVTKIDLLGFLTLVPDLER